MENFSYGDYDPMLDTFDKVVVLMLENRSYDNLLGYLYPNGVPDNAPLGKTVEGVIGKNLSNPVPAGTVNPPPDGASSIPVMPLTDGNSHSPFPDPGETYDHVNTQLFNFVNGHNQPPYNLPPDLPLPIPGMQGFVNDYIYNFKTGEEKGTDPTYEQYMQIMECYTPSAVPVLNTLAEEFGVFDHWFCAVPSQTWCNRAFWHAGTSWGHVVNGGSLDENSLKWVEDSKGPTIFNQVEDSGLFSPLNWKVYTDQPYVALTTIIHMRALEDFHIPPFDHFAKISDFLNDCANGKLPAYSFLEPSFWSPHTDMHPSSFDSPHYGPEKYVGEVLLGEYLVAKLYDAIRTSPDADRTLFIITFDEHGGCYDHLPPPTVNAPDLTGYTLEDDFDFKRLGVRVPAIMISSHIAKNTVVNTPMHHGSFMKTMGKKWDKIVPGKFPPLTARVETAPEFTEVFTSPEIRPACSWPVIPLPIIPEGFFETDYSGAPMSKLGESIIGGVEHLASTRAARLQSGDVPDLAAIKTVGAALKHLASIPGLRPEK
jgi:phospholipase C